MNYCDGDYDESDSEEPEEDGLRDFGSRSAPSEAEAAQQRRDIYFGVFEPHTDRGFTRAEATDFFGSRVDGNPVKSPGGVASRCSELKRAGLLANKGGLKRMGHFGRMQEVLFRTEKEWSACQPADFLSKGKPKEPPFPLTVLAEGLAALETALVPYRTGQALAGEPEDPALALLLGHLYKEQHRQEQALTNEK